MKFLNDEYTLDIKQLADEDQIKKIHELILNAHTPFSIGISGRWGSGKTSIMKYLMASLGGEPIKHNLNFQPKTIEEENNFKTVFESFYEDSHSQEKFKARNLHTIWFNPWENESHNEPMVGLLQAIHHHFSFFASTSKEVEKLLSISFQAGLDMLGSLNKLGKNSGTNIKNIGENYEYDNFQYIERNQKFKFIFQEAIEILLQRNMSIVDDDARIVIFIDDLDRCEDETIEKLLKEIKQYLSTKRCIFIFGYDRHHIEKSLAKTSTKTAKETRAYLEKLFQATFYIKEPSETNLTDFTLEIIEQYSFIEESDCKGFSTFIISIVDSNPRRLKNYLTALYFHVNSSSFCNESKINMEDLKKLAMITYLKLFYESVYSALENQPMLLLADLLVIFNNRSLSHLSNQRQYFLHLEFKSHLHEIDVMENIENTDYTKNYEDKFLNEVYEMQGKHKTFEQYMREFSTSFTGMLDITKYL